MVDEGAADGPPIRFEILGPLRAWRGDDELDLGPGKQRSVLAVLLLNANKPTSTSTIVDAVWQDDPPENGTNVVQKYVAGLRRVLEPHRSPRTPARLLTWTDAGYVLQVESGGLDSDAFQHRVRVARAAWSDNGAVESLEDLRAALELWHGPALAGLQGPLFDTARDRLTDARAGALEMRAEIELELGQHDRLVPELFQLTSEFPLREQLRYLLILALYRCGRQAEALAAYREARDFLAEEFGVEPGERLRTLQLSILRADPALAAVHRSAPLDGPPPAPDAAPPPAWETDPPSVTPAAPTAGRSGQSRWNRWLIKFFVIAISLGGLGMFSWAFVAYAAHRRRSLLLTLAASGYFVAAGVFWATVGAEPNSAVDRVTTVAFLLSAIAGAVHAVLLVPVVPGPRPPAVPNGPGERTARRSGHHRTISRGNPISLPSETPGPVTLLPIALPLVSCGMLSWVGIAYLAVRRRSGVLAAAAVGYIAPVVVFYFTADAEETEPAGLPVKLAVVLLLLAWGGGTLHTALLVLGRNHGPAEVEPVEAMRRRVRREQARTLLEQHPEIARELRIGRPDLHSGFDDGGLVDVNAVPEHILAALPGITARQAARIVTDRQVHGGFASVDDLATRGLLPAPLGQTLRDVLIVVRQTG